MADGMDGDLDSTVASVLSLAEKSNKEKYRSTEVTRDVEPDLDIGNLLATDLQPVDGQEFRKNKEDFLRNLARDNTQLLLNAIWKLPHERSEGVVVVKLPEPYTVIPREKPIPKPKLPSKWEEFAKRKGITKKKRERMILDKNTQEWKPRFGYKRGNDETQEWLLEVPQNADPYEDQFEKKFEAKKERVAKNEYQRLRNIARNRKISVPNKDLAPSSGRQSKEQISEKLNISRLSTASLGKFTEKLRDEKISRKTGKKRKFEPVVGDLSNERSRSRELAEKIARRGPLDVNKAVNQHITEAQKRGSEFKKKGAGKGKKGKGKPAAQNRNKKPAGKSPRKSGKKKVKI
ncbi:ribosome biogenesis regulatory protein homolog [Pocillopora verrucosa]|uniref:ribosome biogenesis regulatory protein homolog n=1 Tax=Pocillopora verrucosa TaxID=203993 RepID=UPI0033416EA6